MLPFKGVAYDKNIGASPAAVNLRTGMLYINKSVFYQYPEAWQRFILLHEAGHYNLQTFDELKADEYAFHHFVKEGHSLKDAVLSLKEVLNESNTEHAERIKTQLDKAFWWDKHVFDKVFIEPTQRIIKMNQYLEKESEQVAYCLGNGDAETAKKHMANILLVVDPRFHDGLLEHFAEALTDTKIGPETENNFLTGFLEFGNEAYHERTKLKAEAKADLKSEYAKFEGEPRKGDKAIEVAGNVAGGVANAIIPGSGPLVAKIVQGGGKIISGIVAFFKKNKDQGKTDAQIFNDPEFQRQQALAAKELEQLYQDSAIFNEKWAEYLGKFTDADRTFATMRKSAKMKREILPEAGKIDGGKFYYAGKTLKLSNLNVYKPVFGLGAGVDAPVYVDTTGSNSGSTGLGDPNATQRPEDNNTEAESKKKPSLAIMIGIVVALILIGVGIYFATRKKVA